MSVIMSKRERGWALTWAFIIVGLTCLPYLIAWQLAPAGTQYTGLLINHFDGESYYAKMQQGARGDWLFHLAFTPEPHPGAFIFVFYLLLGHLASILGLPIPLIYHLARIASGLFMLVVAYRFIAHFFPRMPTRRAGFLLLGLSSGFGWLLAPLGWPTADLWVAEGLTFLSIFANPHFPLAIGLMLLIFLHILETGHLREEAEQPGQLIRGLGAALLGLALAVVQPFAIPIVLVVLAVHLGILALRYKRLPLEQVLVAASTALGAAPLMIYDLHVYRTNPALAAWSAQNLTPSLPPWDYAMGYGLVLLLAIGGTAIALHRRGTSDLFLLSWAGSVVVLLYVPFALQRRFIAGLHVPLVLLAAIALEDIIWPRIQPARRSLVTGLLVFLSALTNLFVPLISVAGVAQGSPLLVMTRDETAILAWLGENTSWTDTVLAPADMGQFIPAWAGNRVVYGHPFETIEAEIKKAEVAHFFGTDATPTERRALLDRYGARYVVAPAEAELDPAALGLLAVWRGDTTVLYRVEGTL